MKRFKFLDRRNLQYEVKFLYSVEVDEALRAKFQIQVCLDKDYEIILITDNFYVSQREKIYEIMNAYEPSDNIRTLVHHLRMRFVHAYIEP